MSLELEIIDTILTTLSQMLYFRSYHDGSPRHFMHKPSGQLRIFQMARNGLSFPHLQHQNPSLTTMLCWRSCFMPSLKAGFSTHYLHVCQSCHRSASNGTHLLRSSRLTRIFHFSIQSCHITTCAFVPYASLCATYPTPWRTRFIVYI